MLYLDEDSLKAPSPSIEAPISYLGFSAVGFRRFRVLGLGFGFKV